MALASWLTDAKLTYLGNATSTRDFRVQMRGSKPFWIFSLYVFLLCLFGFAFYASIVARSNISLAGAQQELSTFFNALMVLLAVAICLFSPAMTATAIVAERQRQSLDLVLSAPVKPKYLLVGKIISSYRYTWMLLILALPVVAMSVVLGGATWQDVFGCFLLLSFHALIFTSLALLISTVTTRPAAAVIWSLFAVLGYNVVAAMLSTASAASRLMGAHGGHAPFSIALSPFTALQAIQTSTAVGSVDVPNWVLAALVALLLSRLFLLGAAVNLAPLDRRLSANLRITGLLYTYALSGLVVMATASVFRITTYASSMPTTSHADLYTMNAGVACVAWVLFMIPSLTCCGWDGSRRFWPNGFVSPRHMLDGTPAGGLPYAIVLVVTSIAGAATAATWSGSAPLTGAMVSGLLWPVGIVVLAWSCGRLLSAVCNSIRTARWLTQLVILLALLGLPAALSILQLAPSWAAPTDYPTATTSAWYLWLVAPAVSSAQFVLAPIYGAVTLVAGAIIALLARRAERRRWKGRAVA